MLKTVVPFNIFVEAALFFLKKYFVTMQKSLLSLLINWMHSYWIKVLISLKKGDTL